MAVHFTEDVYVVYKRKRIGEQYDTHEVEDIARNLSYPDALNMVEFTLTRYNKEMPCEEARLLYSYVRQSEFDKYQERYKVNPQLSLF